MFLILGEGNTGKSTADRILIEKSGILDFPQSVVIEADEKISSAKLDDRIKSMHLRNRDDFREIETLNARLMLVDTAGTSKVFMKDSVKNAKNLHSRGVIITPIMLVGARGISDSEITEWLETLVGLPKMYVVLNPMRNVSESFLNDLEQRIKEIPGPTDKIFLRMPVLETAIAKELEIVGCALSKISQGLLSPKESNLLTYSSVILDVADWETAVTMALQPIIDDIVAARPEALVEEISEDENPEFEAEPEAEPTMPDADTVTAHKAAPTPKAKAK